MRLLAAAILGVLALAHVIPASRAPGAGTDELAHVAFGALAFVAMYLDASGRGLPRLADAGLRGLFALALLEALQALVPGRSPSITDLASDAVGCLGAGVVIAPLSRRH